MSENPRTSLPLLNEALDNLRKLGLGAAVWDRPVSPKEVQYFLDRWPFVQLLSTNELPVLPQVEQRTAPTGWVILNYGDAMASSPGRHLFGHHEDDQGGGEGEPPRHGTIWRQTFETAEHMVALAQQLGWQGVHVVDGHPMMEWAVWMAALDRDLVVTGFEPEPEDYDRRARVKRSALVDLKYLQPTFAK